MFYYEELTALGNWSPRTMDERPSAKTSTGTKRNIRNVQEVPFDWELQPLAELQRRFNPVAETPEEPKIKEGVGAFMLRLAKSHGAELNESTVTFQKDDLVEMMKKLTNPVNIITNLADMIHEDNVRAGWWTDLKTGEDLHGKRNVGELLCLIHSEVSEAMEGHRKRLMDDKLPHRPMLKVELIDAMIRILDLLGSEGNREHPAGTIFQEKRDYNAKRADHKPEARLAAGGKVF